MKTYRSMVLVSSDPLSIERGSQKVYDLLAEGLKKYGIEDEVSLTMVADVGRHDAVPLVIVYPDAVFVRITILLLTGKVHEGCSTRAPSTSTRHKRQPP